jgi:CubicO group peptidase (beta-lactamase class C family)
MFARVPNPSQVFVMSDQLTAEGLEQLRAVASEHVADDRIPGLVALVARGGQVHVETLGALSIGGAPVSHESLFRIASTTKPITAVATLTHVGEGLGARPRAG